jgi:hypothetical protein
MTGTDLTMDELKTIVNDYLFLEFGVDGDEAQVSEDWPFELRKLAETPDLTVFEFHDDEPFFALAGNSINFLPQSGMSVDDLLLQQTGAKWIGAREPIDLSEVRLGDPAVPAGSERRRHLEALGAATAPGEAVEILEGLFLRAEQRYLALFESPGRPDAFVGGLPGADSIVVPFPEASAWRRLAWGVGRWLQRQGA